MKKLTLIGSMFSLMAASTFAIAGGAPSDASLNADEYYLADESVQETVVMRERSEFSAMETGGELKSIRGNTINDDEDFHTTYVLK